MTHFEASLRWGLKRMKRMKKFRKLKRTLPRSSSESKSQMDSKARLTSFHLF